MIKKITACAFLIFTCSYAMAGEPLFSAECAHVTKDSGSSALFDYLGIKYVDRANGYDRYIVNGAIYRDGVSSSIKSGIVGCQIFELSGSSKSVVCYEHSGGQAVMIEPTKAGFKMTVAQGLASPRVIEAGDCFFSKQ